MGLTKKCNFLKNGYTLGRPQKWVVFLGNFLHSERSPIVSCVHHFLKLSQILFRKKVRMILVSHLSFRLTRFFCGYCTEVLYTLYRALKIPAHSLSFYLLKPNLYNKFSGTARLIRRSMKLLLIFISYMYCHASRIL